MADNQSHKEELDRIKRDLSFANERAEDASRHKSSEVSGVMAKYNRQLTELEDSLRASGLFARALIGSPNKPRSMISFTNLIRKTVILRERWRKRSKNYSSCKKEWTTRSKS